MIGTRKEAHMMKVWRIGLCLFCFGALTITATARDDDEIALRASLLGANEAPPINTPATGRFSATIHADGTIDFTLTYADLSSLPTQSHIHFAPKNVGGGVMVFLCGGDTQPACPATTSGSFTGTITPANVVAIAGQGVNAGDLASALRIIVEQGEGYANLHSTRFPGGEIRGQVQVRREHGRED
jgi:hypothetical protein